MVKGFRAGTSLSTSKATRLMTYYRLRTQEELEVGERVGFARLSSGSKGKVRTSKGNEAHLNIAIRSRIGRSTLRDSVASNVKKFW